MGKITPFLMFDGRLGEALDFYTSIFPNSSVSNSSKTPDGGVRSATFELEGQKFNAYDGGPHFEFSDAFSLFVAAETQPEIDDLWTKLTADGGQESRCGWLKDKFGLSWQIVPPILLELMSDPDPAKSKATVDAMLTMGKLDIAALQKAHDEA